MLGPAGLTNCVPFPLAEAEACFAIPETTEGRRDAISGAGDATRRWRCHPVSSASDNELLLQLGVISYALYVR